MPTCFKYFLQLEQQIEQFTWQKVQNDEQNPSIKLKTTAKWCESCTKSSDDSCGEFLMRFQNQ